MRTIPTHRYKWINNIVGLLTTALLTLSPGCSDIPNGGIPVQLRMDSTTVAPPSSDPTHFGSLSHAFYDVWVDAGANRLGAFQTPVRVPILDSGELVMTLSPGILDNGLYYSRVIYAMMKPDTFTLHHAVPGRTYYHHPRYSYLDSVQVGVIEDFERSTSQFDGLQTIHSGATLDSIVFEGNGSGVVFLNNVADTSPLPHPPIPIDGGYQDTTILLHTPIPIKAHGREVYLEMNYRLSVAEAEVGIMTVIGGVRSNKLAKIVLEPADHWIKIYINLSSLIGNNPADSYYIYLNPFKPQNTPKAFFAVDNIKLLYLH